MHQGFFFGMQSVFLHLSDAACHTSMQQCVYLYRDELACMANVITSVKDGPLLLFTLWMLG